MDISVFLHTIQHLRMTQVIYQLWYRMHKARYRQLSAPTTVRAVDWTEWIEKGRCLMDDGTFCFLNIKDGFHDWNQAEHGALWTYNLNYMDWLCQESVTFGIGAEWIDRFISDMPANSIGLDPYPTALRGINWIKFISRHKGETAPEQFGRWNDALYSQYRLLERKLELHLMGNHLLEDAYSLFIGSVYFRDERMYSRACRLLRHELDEQTLADGAHYEQSPMYHCILLDRLLDCLSMAQHADGLEGLQQMRGLLTEHATRMLGHLESICYEDGTYPLLGDSARGIAPTPGQLRDYGRRLHLTWHAIGLSACGYRHFRSKDMEAFVDVGNITATYQPGHTHADTLGFELRVDGKPFIVDTGISTYNKTGRRQYERSTEAHNTVTIEGRGASSEVWGGFRVGRRAMVTLLEDSEERVRARHDGYKPAMHERLFTMDDNGCTVTDSVTDSDRQAHCRLHLAGDVRIESRDAGCIRTNRGMLSIHGATAVNIEAYQYSETYNEFVDSQLIDIAFADSVTVEIRKR